MMNPDEKNDDSKNAGDDSYLEQVQIHKILIKVQKILDENKNKSINERKFDLKEYLTNCEKNIILLEDDEKNSLAQIAIKNSQLENLKIIISVYKDILPSQREFFLWVTHENNEGMTLFETSSVKGNIAIIKYLSDSLKIEFSQYFNIESTKNNVFHYAAKKNHCFPIIFFYERFQKMYPRILILDAQNHEGRSPLHLACYYGSKKSMDLLIDLGANINSIDNDGNTPLHLAVKSGSERCIKKLLIRGANKKIKNHQGKIPYDFAVADNNDNLIDLLMLKTNCQKTFGSREIGPVKGGRNNLMLVLVTMIMIFVKILFFFRIFNLIFEDLWPKDLIPHVPNLIDSFEEEKETTEIAPFKRMPKKVKDIEEYINCFLGDHCISIIPFYSLSLIGDIILLIMTTYFLCFAHKVYSKKRNKKEVRYLSPLFENNNDVCVKCRNIISSNTVHCLVCNACVDDWDHHCFWLNTCISEKNKKGFAIFFYSTFIFMALNILLFLILFIYSFFTYDEFFNDVFSLTSSKSSKAFIIIQRIIFAGITLFMFLFSGYCEFFIMIPLLKNRCQIREEEDNNSIGRTLSQYQAQLLSKPSELSGITDSTV